MLYASILLHLQRMHLNGMLTDLLRSLGAEIRRCAGPGAALPWIWAKSWESGGVTGRKVFAATVWNWGRHEQAGYGYAGMYHDTKYIQTRMQNYHKLSLKCRLAFFPTHSGCRECPHGRRETPAKKNPYTWLKHSKA